eukprot:11244453-Heterocapsa_arctica.AAC.1
MFSKPGCRIIRLAMCAFGAPYRKNTQFGLVNSEHLAPSAQKCPGLHKHLQLTGSLCTAAS